MNIDVSIDDQVCVISVLDDGGRHRVTLEKRLVSSPRLRLRPT